MTGKRPDEILKRFTDRYSTKGSSALDAVENEAIGAVVGASGYTTVAQAELLIEVLRLTRGMWLLDVGAGRGWPGLYLSERSDCRTAVTDVPRPAIITARSRAERLGLTNRCHFALAGGATLPFRDRSFDAIVHTDTL
jgi:ubiquinone/menaquinone biosynthesis C-methylase UbiE